jgi:CofD-related protein of GAK system
MSVRVHVSHGITIPDPLRVERSRRSPEHGARLLFFSGGSALRPLSRALKQYTHNSIHLVTPFDSGGSSAVIRRSFRVLSVGDIRNRLVALADESVLGNPQIYRLFAHRLDKHGEPDLLRQELLAMIDRQHPLIAGVPEPMRQTLSSQLRFFFDRAPVDFDLSGANIGNLLLIGAYLSYGMNIDSAIFVLSKLLEVRGVVWPTVDADCHLAVRLADGRTIVGQHLITGKEVPALNQRIADISLVDSLGHGRPVTIPIGDKVRQLIERSAELVCYSYGSFYSSLLANLLPSGVGRAIARADCLKVYVPNLGDDPEQFGMSLSNLVDRLVFYLRKDAGPDVPVDRLLNLVLLDPRWLPAGSDEALPRLHALGVRTALLDFSEQQQPRVEPERLAQILISLV